MVSGTKINLSCGVQTGACCLFQKKKKSKKSRLLIAILAFKIKHKLNQAKEIKEAQ